MHNAVKRSISGIVFVAIMVSFLLLSKYTYAVLLSYMTVTMLTEFYRMTMGKEYQFTQTLAILSGQAMFVLIFLTMAFPLPVNLIVYCILPLLIVMINSLYVQDKTDFWKFSHIYAGILYIAVPLALSNLLVFSHGEYSGLLLLCFFVIIWGFDIGSYVFGMALGGKIGAKIFVAISPKKTWIGFYGGLLIGVCTAVVLKLVGWLEFPLFHCALLAVVMCIGGLYGDLFESQWKRCYSLKDSGTLMPGHGGMLDRFDSSLLAIPAGVIYLVIFKLL